MSIAMSSCRLCKSPLPEDAFFRLAHVPARVQHFLDDVTQDADEAVSLAIFRCEGCGLIQLKTASVIYAEEATSATSYSASMLDYRREQMRHFVERFALQGQHLLDVGCGDGHLLRILTELGTHPIGVDASKKAIELAQSQGFEAHFAYITRQERVKGQPFDAFVSMDVIEHVDDLTDFVQGIAANLRDGAVGLIETPSFEKTLEHQRFYDFIPDHLSYFTHESLRLTLELGGFEVLEIEQNRDGENLTALVKKRPTADLSLFDGQMRQLQANLASFLTQSEHDGKRVAIWGAGLQTLTILASFQLSNIAYIIDSAPYKQGKFTPLSHVPILAPEILATDAVEVILVIASRYLDEILSKIKQTDFAGTVAVLDGITVRIEA